MGRFRTSGCVIEYEGKILFVHQVASDFWGFPKGSMMDGESTSECALREVREETGVELSHDQLIHKFDWNKSRLYFVKLTSAPVVKIDGYEIDKYRWEPLEFLQFAQASTLTQAIAYKLTCWKKLKSRSALRYNNGCFNYRNDIGPLCA